MDELVLIQEIPASESRQVRLRLVFFSSMLCMVLLMSSTSEQQQYHMLRTRQRELVKTDIMAWSRDEVVRRKSAGGQSRGGANSTAIQLHRTSRLSPHSQIQLVDLDAVPPAEGGWVETRPRDISGSYKGNWSSSLVSHAPAKAEAQEDMQRLIIPHPHDGLAFLRLNAHASITDPSIHFVTGEALLREGRFSSVMDVKVILQGVYLWRHRQLHLLGSSLGNVLYRLDRLSGNATSESPEGGLSDHAMQLQREYLLHAVDAMGTHPVSRHRLITDLVVTGQVHTSASPQHAQQPQQSQHRAGFVALMVDCKMSSKLMNLSIKLSANSFLLEDMFGKMINYTLVVTIVSLLQILLLIRQMEYSSFQSMAVKVSIVTIGYQAILDAYLCLVHLTAGIVREPLFNAFATAAFFKFVVFSIFEMRYILMIWKASRPDSVNADWLAMRRELSVLYSKFYGFLLGGIFLMYELQSHTMLLTFLVYSYWVPQIVHSVLNDCRKPLQLQYIWGITCTRLAIPLYVLLCPQNFLSSEPDYELVIKLLVWKGLQALILTAQHRWGARCFIPSPLLPQKYNYKRLAISHEAAATNECAICMGELNTDVEKGSKTTMVTPCNHIFHDECLAQWMDIKMECPVCRQLLPPV